MSEPRFKKEEEDRIEEHRPLPSDHVFEVVRRAGEEELQRPTASLAWSGLAAGLAIGFSVVTEAAILGYLPVEATWTPLVSNIGYTVGFIIVVLARLQLFTENTITPVMPICHEPSPRNLVALARNWGVVFAANMVGAVLFGFYAVRTGALPEEVRSGVLELGRHATDGHFLETVVRGIGAGFLIAVLVWMLANLRNGKLLAIFVVTYTIALCEFAHVVAGSVEMAALAWAGEAGLGPVVFGFVLPALIGNVIGGTLLFTLLAYAQIRLELGGR